MLYASEFIYARALDSLIYFFFSLPTIFLFACILWRVRCLFQTCARANCVYKLETTFYSRKRWPTMDRRPIRSSVRYANVHSDGTQKSKTKKNVIYKCLISVIIIAGAAQLFTVSANFGLLAPAFVVAKRATKRARIFLAVIN